MLTPKKLLLFGASGSIGQAIHARYEMAGWSVVTVTHKSSAHAANISWSPFNPSQNTLQHSILKSRAPYDAVVWAQGLNLGDSLYSFNLDKHLKLYEANVLFVVQALSELLSHGCLNLGSKLCVISSIWQSIARQEKLSYCITKAALKGLVLSAAADVAREGHLINAVLPGVLDTPMSRANLKPQQVECIERSTLFNRLPEVQDVANAVFQLASDENTGITGQFVTVDLGFSNVRII
jgi:NAD(P)-dependent dehydrogenase (short-subunit alcohol dehydrogenase family)